MTYVFKNFSTNDSSFKLVGPPDSPGPWTRHVSYDHRKGRKCIEFSWDKTGNLHFHIGFVIGDSCFNYYHYANNPYFVERKYPSYTEIYRRSIGINSLGEQIMICGDSYEKSIIVVNKNIQYKYIKSVQGTYGNMYLLMGQGRSSNSVDNIYLKYRQSNFTNKMPFGFNAWKYCGKTNAAQNKRIFNIVLLFIFVCVYS